MRLELVDERFVPLPDYSGGNAGHAEADSLSSAVSWPKGDFGSIAGKKVRLLIHLERKAPVEPRLYAVYVAED